VSLAPKFDQLNVLIATSYLLSYRYGISSRGIIATFIDILTNNAFISKYFVWHFIFCSTVFLSFLISVYLGFVIRKSVGHIKTFVLFLSLLYLSCFTSPSTYFSVENFGRVEIFAFLFMLVLITVINKPIVRWIIPLLALFTLAIHIILVFFYIPFIGIIMLYELLSKENGKKNTAFLLTTTITIVVMSFLAYLLFHERTFVFQNAHDLTEYLKTKSDLYFTAHFIFMTLFAQLQDHLNDWHDVVSLIYRGNLSIIINIPSLAFFVVLWIKCFLREKNTKMRFFFLLPIFSLVYQSIAFFMFYDFGRWMIMILNVQFLLIFYLLYVKNETLYFVVRKAVPYIYKHWLMIVLVCFLMIFLGPVTEIGPSSKVTRIFNGLLYLLTGQKFN
jgi:hypothetical protein